MEIPDNVNCLDKEKESIV